MHEGHRDEDYAHEVVTVASPPAATGFSKVVPGASRWRVQSVSFVLVADANAANRIPRVEYLDASGGVFAAVAAPFVLTANLTARFTFAIGVVQFGANAAAQIGASLPALHLNPGLSVRVAVTGIQVGDQISGAAMFVDQWSVRD